MQALSLRRIAVSAATAALLHRLGRFPISGERLRPPTQRKHHRSPSSASSFDGMRENGDAVVGRKSSRVRRSPRQEASLDKDVHNVQSDDKSFDSLRGHRWAFSAGAGDRGLQNGSTQVLDSSNSSDGMESDSSGQYTANSSDTLSDGRAYSRRSSIPFIATVAATATDGVRPENMAFNDAPLPKSSPIVHRRDDSVCSDLTTGSTSSSESSSQLRAVSKAGGSNSVLQPTADVMRATKVPSSDTPGSNDAASTLLESLRRAGVGDLESYLGRAGLAKYFDQFCGTCCPFRAIMFPFPINFNENYLCELLCCKGISNEFEIDLITIPIVCILRRIWGLHGARSFG